MCDFIQEFRQNLPSWKAQEEVLHLVKSSQVSVISGETGCGKTTQVLTLVPNVGGEEREAIRYSDKPMLKTAIYMHGDNFT